MASPEAILRDEPVAQAIDQLFVDDHRMIRLG